MDGEINPNAALFINRGEINTEKLKSDIEDSASKWYGAQGEIGQKVIDEMASMIETNNTTEVSGADEAKVGREKLVADSINKLAPGVGAEIIEKLSSGDLDESSVLTQTPTPALRFNSFSRGSFGSNVGSAPKSTPLSVEKMSSSLSRVKGEVENEQMMLNGIFEDIIENN